MSYVEPSGIIQLFKGIRLDNRYMHTIYFASASAQNTWFTSKQQSGLTFNKQMYTRPYKGYVRLKINSENVQDCTYLRFQNKTGGMWYYCFITAIEYLNENTTQIRYEIDVMQTWFIQRGTLNACMVLREHVSNDDFGTHLEPEPIGSDVYELDGIPCADMDTHFNEDDYVVIQTTADPNNPPSGGSYAPQEFIKHGIFDGAWYYEQVLNGDITQGGVQDIYDALNNCLGNWDAGMRKADILSIIQFPGHFCNHPEETYNITHPNNLNGYEPENNKLYCYPYSYLLVSTMDGKTAQYRWEYFNTDVTASGATVQFRLLANELGMGAIALYPTYYNRVTDNFDAKLVMDNFPKCAFAYDSYQAWMASGGKTKIEYETGIAEQRGAMAKEQAMNNAILNVASSTMDIIQSGAEFESDPVSSVAGMGKGLLSATSTSMNAYYSIKGTDITLDEARHKQEFVFKDAQYHPNVMVGTQAPTLAMGYNKLRYRFFNVHIKKEELQRLDDFLTVFGYAVNKVDVPKIHNRPYWNFIQTRGCNVTGNMPASSMSAINKIFDGGIFFWKNGDQVGNFEVGGRNGYGALQNK